MSNIETCPHFTSPHFLFFFNFLKLTAATTANFFNRWWRFNKVNIYS